MTPEVFEKTNVRDGQFQTFSAAEEIQRPASVASHYSDKSIEEGITVDDEAHDHEKTNSKEVSQKSAGMLVAIKLFLFTWGSWVVNVLGGGMRARSVYLIQRSIWYALSLT